MNRKKNENCWIHVTRVANGRFWQCKYCNLTFEGDASRIKAHLGLDGETGNITRCFYYDGDEQVHNNLASSSNNPILVQGEKWSIRDRSIFESKISNLKGMVIDLENEENDIAKQTQWLKSRGKKRKPEVDVWIKESHELKERVGAVNNLDDMNELFKDMKRHKGEKPLTLSTEFVGKALDVNIKKVFHLLNDDRVFVIGIYGMGGVGKTLLASLVESEIKKKGTFKHVFWVNVSPNFTISKLQHDIAKRIGMELDEDDERSRANKLSTTLETKENSVLILDDVWKYIDLEKVGVSTKANGIKVILTTRLKHVCQQMDCLPSHMINVIPLFEVDEGWELFKVKLGHYGTPAILSPEIENIARVIVDRFEGLPLGISVMARTMKGIDYIGQWKHSLNKLNKLESGQEVNEEVFEVLKRSYDNLTERDLQNCFLYCALLTCYEAYDRDEMIMKLVDNGLINGNRCLEEIFEEGYTVLGKLASHSLMSSCEHSYQFNFQLSIDTACYIMKESKRNAMVKFENELTKTNIAHEWAADLEFVHIWASDIEEIPEGVSPYCPRLSTLIINQSSVRHVPESFFKCMNTITILDLSYSEKLECLPNCISKMKSLVSLVLVECNMLKHVPPLGELKALSRLVISDCSIKEVPQGLDKLLNLKWLDLSVNESLSFELGSLNLTKLQYLDLQDTRAKISIEDIQRMTMLECFGGAFDCKHYDQYVQSYLDIRSGLKAYHLILGNVHDESRSVLRNNIYLKTFDRSDPEIMTILFRDCDHFSHMLPKDLTCLHIDKNDHWVCLCDALSCNMTSSLKRIGTYDCRQLERLFCLSDSCSFCSKIHKLEILELESLKRLTVIGVDARRSPSLGGIFSCLQSFYISECHLIEKLITPMLVQQLQNLETISVRCCNSMKEILAVSDDISDITLPKLKRLVLDYLPQLKIVCKGSIHCGSSPPKLTISHCPSLERYPTIKCCKF
ncbi:unnamed protein product [Lathyrus oleraceus]